MDLMLILLIQFKFYLIILIRQAFFAQNLTVAEMRFLRIALASWICRILVLNCEIALRNHVQRSFVPLELAEK